MESFWYLEKNLSVIMTNAEQNHILLSVYHLCAQHTFWSEMAWDYAPLTEMDLYFSVEFLETVSGDCIKIFAQPRWFLASFFLYEHNFRYGSFRGNSACEKSPFHLTPQSQAAFGHHSILKEILRQSNSSSSWLSPGTHSHLVMPSLFSGPFQTCPLFQGKLHGYL